jgi:hypothetical protein
MHDLGKADPRFQADLRGASALARHNPMVGALLAATQGELLAKGRQPGAGRGPRAAPENFRHEALSVALADRHPGGGQAVRRRARPRPVAVGNASWLGPPILPASD